MINVRPYTPNDRTFILNLAPRLAIGKQSWRDLALWLKTVEGWLSESISQHNQKTMVLVAENEQGERLGFATVSHSTHFTGQRHWMPPPNLGMPQKSASLYHYLIRAICECYI